MFNKRGCICSDYSCTACKGAINLGEGTDFKREDHRLIPTLFSGFRRRNLPVHLLGSPLRLGRFRRSSSVSFAGGGGSRRGGS